MPAQKKDPSSQVAPAQWIADAITGLPPICKLPEVSRATRVSVRQLRTHIAAGQIRTLRAAQGGSSPVLVPRAEVVRFLESLVQP